MSSAGPSTKRDFAASVFRSAVCCSSSRTGRARSPSIASTTTRTAATRGVAVGGRALLARVAHLLAAARLRR
jgi:hypothetical protein